MKIFIQFAFFILLSSFSFSQSHDLTVHGESGKLYLVHKVIAKENWYSVGRIYNVSPKEIAPFNGLTLEHPLGIGQELKIPLSHINFSQDGKKNADETFVPVYHDLQTNETLSHVSSTYDKVPVENLMKWNKIKKDGAKEGMQLVIGYIKVKTSLSYLASAGSNKVDAVAETKNNVEETIPGSRQEKKSAAIVDKPRSEIKHDTKPTATNAVAPDQPKAVYTNVSNSNHFANGGYFSSDYSEGNNKESGSAGTFKSSSGWNDGKYYVLINNVPVGTIIKVIAPATQKSIYAKVLGLLPDMKESEGLLIRISNAAASELGEPEGKFGVQVKY